MTLKQLKRSGKTSDVLIDAFVRSKVEMGLREVDTWIMWIQRIRLAAWLLFVPLVVIEAVCIYAAGRENVSILLLVVISIPLPALALFMVFCEWLCSKEFEDHLQAVEELKMGPIGGVVITLDRATLDQVFKTKNIVDPRWNFSAQPTTTEHK